MKNLILILILITSGCGYYNDASNTAFNETKASTQLKRYEQFKELASAIQKKKADIEVYKDELKRKPTSRLQEESLEQRRAEMLGLISSHNQLVSQYNADMAKINYAYTNRGELPQSNLEPLPKEFQNYILTNE